MIIKNIFRNPLILLSGISFAGGADMGGGDVMTCIHVDGFRKKVDAESTRTYLADYWSSYAGVYVSFKNPYYSESYSELVLENPQSWMELMTEEEINSAYVKIINEKGINYFGEEVRDLGTRSFKTIQSMNWVEDPNLEDLNDDHLKEVKNPVWTKPIDWVLKGFAGLIFGTFGTVEFVLSAGQSRFFYGAIANGGFENLRCRPSQVAIQDIPNQEVRFHPTRYSSMSFVEPAGLKWHEALEAEGFPEAAGVNTTPLRDFHLDATINNPSLGKILLPKFFEADQKRYGYILYRLLDSSFNTKLSNGKKVKDVSYAEAMDLLKMGDFKKSIPFQSYWKVIAKQLQRQLVCMDFNIEMAINKMNYASINRSDLSFYEFSKELITDENICR